MSASKQFKKLFRVKNILTTYREKVNNKSAVGLDKVSSKSFEKVLKSELDVISRKAQNGTYNFTPYKQKLISKGADSLPRVISIPTLRDRVTLRIICDLLATLFKDKVQIALPQMKIERIKKEITNPKYQCFVKVDISSFYPSVNHSKLFEILKPKIRKKEILELISSSIGNSTLPRSIKGVRQTNTVGIPQGLANSNILGEIYLTNIDALYEQNQDISYIRYVDDILIFCSKSDVADISIQLSKELKKLDLIVHPIDEKDSKSTTGLLTDNFDYLGYLFKNKTASLKPNNRIRFESSIVNLFTNFKYKYNSAKTEPNKKRAIEILNWRLNLKITGCIFDNKKRGWIFYFSQLDDLNILHEIDAVISKLIKRFNITSEIKQKTLIKSYHESKRVDKDSHKYIINFDKFTVAEKRKTLEIYLGSGKLIRQSNEAIERLFTLRINKIIEELEEDLKEFS